jgi:hypothetical protein
MFLFKSLSKVEKNHHFSNKQRMCWHKLQAMFERNGSNHNIINMHWGSVWLLLRNSDVSLRSCLWDKTFSLIAKKFQLILIKNLQLFWRFKTLNWEMRWYNTPLIEIFWIIVLKRHLRSCTVKLPFKLSTVDN